MKYRSHLFFIGTFSVLALLFSSCNEKAQENTSTNSNQEKKVESKDSSSTQTAKTRDSVARFDPKKELNLSVSGNTLDEMHLNQTTFYVPARTRIKLSINNFTKGKDTKFNFILTKPDKFKEAVIASIAAGTAKNLVPLDTNTYYIATPIIDPGVPLTVNFTTPPKGEYRFVCTYANMHNRLNGKIIVQ